MEELLTQLTTFGFSKELSLKAVAANGICDSGKLVHWIVSHHNDSCINQSESLNFMVLLSISPSCLSLQHYIKQIYNLVVDHVDFYPLTCEYYFSIPLTPLIECKHENIGKILQIFEDHNNILNNLPNLNMFLYPYVNDYILGCALNKEYSEPIKNFSINLLKELEKENLIKSQYNPIYSLLMDEKFSQYTNNKIIFPILTSFDPLITVDVQNDTKIKTLKEALNESLDMQYTEFIHKIKDLLNTICLPMGQPNTDKEDDLAAYTSNDITINLFSFDNRIKNSKIYRPLLQPNLPIGREKDCLDMTDPYVYLNKPYGDHIFDFQASNYDDLKPRDYSITDALPVIDDMIFQTQEEQTKLKEYEKDLDIKPKDHHLLKPIWKSRMIHAFAHKNGLPVSAPRDTLQRVPQICAWNLISNLSLQRNMLTLPPAQQQNPNGDSFECKLHFPQAKDSRVFGLEEGASKTLADKQGNERAHSPKPNPSSGDKTDGAPTRSNRILSKIDFYRMFTKFQEGNQYQPENVPEWWTVAKPDFTIDFEDEKHHVKHRYIIARHGERTDQIFGSEWYVEVFDSEYSHHYRQRDLNEPRFLPKRKTGLKEFFRDAPLSEIGMFESYLTGQYMKKQRLFETINWVYTSPSLRSIQTCNYILKGLGLNEVLKMKIEPGLFEWFGWYKDYCPSFMSPQRLKNCGFNVDLKYTSLLPEVKYDPDETLEDYYARGEKFMRLISKKHDNQAGDILIVGHGATLDVNTRTLLKKHVRDTQSFHELLRKTPYLAVTRIDEFYDGSWVWPRTSPSLPITYIENTSYDWKILTKNKIKNTEGIES